MKLYTSIRRTKESAKILKIDTNNLKIKAKKKDYTIMVAKSIIFLLQSFYVYMQILVFLAAPNNKLQFELALSRYTKHLITLWEMYIRDLVQVYYFDFHQA